MISQINKIYKNNKYNIHNNNKIIKEKVYKSICKNFHNY